MNNKTKVVSIIISISIFMMLVSCQKQKAEWKGTIEEVDGVTIVKNPKEPMYREDIFSLEDLSSQNTFNLFKVQVSHLMRRAGFLLKEGMELKAFSLMFLTPREDLLQRSGLAE